MNTISMPVHRIAKIHGVALGQAKALSPAWLQAYRQWVRNAWLEERPTVSFESDFMSHAGIHLNLLTQGYVELRVEGLELVLHGQAVDDRTVWLVISVPHRGAAKLNIKTESLPGEEGYYLQSRRPCRAGAGSNPTGQSLKTSRLVALHPGAVMRQ